MNQNPHTRGSFFALLLIAAIALLVFLNSCKKENQAPQQRVQSTCAIDLAPFANIYWNHSTGALATLRFDSSGVYYENGHDNGTWSNSNGCDSILISRPSNTFYYRIVSVSVDTLRLQMPLIGVVTYVR